jgi:squalene-hopene/tetraprenyl-beta-curcumene cyclase
MTTVPQSDRRDDVATLAAALMDADVEATKDRAVAWMRGQQAPEGYWKGDLESNTTIEAEDLLLREFLGIRTARDTEETARWIRRHQLADGSWPVFFEGPGDLSTTVESWVALRLAGDAPEAPHMARAQAWVLARGGVARTRVFTRIWLALFGLWSWDELPALPPELILLPKWFPLNIYDWACWARQTIVPLTIVGSARPVHPLPFGVDELHDENYVKPGLSPLFSWAGAFERLDKVLHLYAKQKPGGPRARLREYCNRRAIRWIMDRQEADGSWGGIQPPWVYSILALNLRGYALEHPAVKAGLDGLDGFVVHEDSPEGPVRWVEACQSPVWDTALATIALHDCGVEPDDEIMTRAAGWLLGNEAREPGDWAVRRPDLAVSGWAFEFANVNYPDIDDTAEVVMALRFTTPGLTGPGAAAVHRGIAWTTGMQSADGGWGAFDADNTSLLPTYLPFCDFGNVIDPPSADVTAHVVEMLAAVGRTSSPECRRGVQWLLDNQEADGSWFGRWGANHVYGTGAVVPALIAAGLDPSDPVIRRAVDWLERHQNPDGGWGEDLRSYHDKSLVGQGNTTPAQTAWALLALLAAGRERTDAVRAGIGWLAGSQREDGSWDEPWYTGTGFPRFFYLAYHLYRQVFPMNALGRYLKQVSP